MNTIALKIKFGNRNYLLFGYFEMLSIEGIW